MHRMVAHHDWVITGPGRSNDKAPGIAAMAGVSTMQTGGPAQLPLMIAAAEAARGKRFLGVRSTTVPGSLGAGSPLRLAGWDRGGAWAALRMCEAAQDRGLAINSGSESSEDSELRVDSPVFVTPSDVAAVGPVLALAAWHRHGSAFDIEGVGTQSTY